MIVDEFTFHGIQTGVLVSMAGVVGSVAWRVLKTASMVSKTAGRIESMLKNFPPHRHINGKILYPEGFEPTELEELKRP